MNNPLKELGSYKKIQEYMKKEACQIQLSGCIDASKAFVIANLLESSCKLVVTHSEQRAKELVEDYKFYQRNVYYYPARDVLFYQADIRGNYIGQQRLSVIKRLFKQEEITIVTTFDALMDRLVPPEEVASAVMDLKVGESADLKEIQERLVALGYEKNYQVEAAGEYALRGGILDVFPLSEEAPVRIEFWGDDIDAIRSFDVESQRSIENLEQISIYPAVEIVLDKKRLEKGIKNIEKDAVALEGAFRKEHKSEDAYRVKDNFAQLKEALEEGTLSSAESYLTYFYKETASLLDYTDSKNTIVFFDEPANGMEKGEAVELEFTESMKSRLQKGYCLPKQAEVLCSVKQVLARLKKERVLSLTTLDQSIKKFKQEEVFSIMVHSINAYNKSFELLVKDLQKYKKQKSTVVLVSASKSRGQQLAKDLFDHGLSAYYAEDRQQNPKPGEILVTNGRLRMGFEFPLLSFVMISESDIFGEEKKRRKKKRFEGDRIHDFAQLKVGDYVVHESHGLGIYRGIEKVEVDKVVKDYLKIEYDKGGCLYVQANNLEHLQKYAGQDAKKPKLNKLGSQEWNKTKTKVRSAVREIARDLVKLYAIREQIEGYQFSPDSVWQQEFEDLFPYVETDDQLMAISATKQDMESKKAMDRLICGDVGFGKTEIAIRAAFKAVQDSKQVVYLVPTTILAEQHYNNFAARMKDYPIRVELLCRFVTPARQKQIIADLKRGEVDIVIGTHRLLSKDVTYKNLGLLIIDEEQRFGVAHKEKIKQLKNSIDVLTLTATPIPRTLHMSLVGIRDMSVLEEAPVDRLPIQTYVLEYNEEMIKEAILREMARNGQVYYVYNKVKSIQDVTDRVQALVPDATVAYAHGQMSERELENIMYQFINGEIDVLVTTTIIETGLDIPNANTIIIQDAENMGLSQLYQLRGRVGRSGRTSYAFLMYKRDKLLKEVAQKRLSAIREFTELGSGIRIAMKDLEIRGAGNILGSDQHGHMEAVGYDLYCKMLHEAITLMQGGEVEEDFETTMDININAFIPATYIQNEYQKLDMYKRIANIETVEDSERILDEFIDRFGEPPKPVHTLLNVALLKAKAHKNFITEITQKGDIIRLGFYEKAPIHVEKVEDFIKEFSIVTNTPGKTAAKAGVTKSAAPLAKGGAHYRASAASARYRQMIKQNQDMAKPRGYLGVSTLAESPMKFIPTGKPPYFEYVIKKQRGQEMDENELFALIEKIVEKSSILLEDKNKE